MNLCTFIAPLTGFKLCRGSLSTPAKKIHRALVCTLPVIALSLTSGCSNTPHAPDWQVNAFSASERAMHAQLTGEARVENLEWNRARSEIARTGQLQRLATLELLRCAGRIASLQVADCPAYTAVQKDAAAATHAYAQYLIGDALSPSTIALLPAVQQPTARAIQSASGTTKPAVTPPPNLAEIKDPLSRLVAAAALWRSGMATPSVVDQAVDTASHQGWRVPLIAWLNVQGQQAHDRGDALQAQAVKRRLQLIEQNGQIK